MPTPSPTHQIRLVSSVPSFATARGHVEMTQMTLMSSSNSSSRPIVGPGMTNEPGSVAFVKGGKRKRLSKVRQTSTPIPCTISEAYDFDPDGFLILTSPLQACDACHKSKRRCDGTGTSFSPYSYTASTTELNVFGNSSFFGPTKFKYSN